MTKKDLTMWVPVILFIINIAIVTPSAWILLRQIGRIDNHDTDIRNLSDRLLTEFATQEDLSVLKSKVTQLDNRLYNIRQP